MDGTVTVCILHRLIVSANKDQAQSQINANSTLSNLIAELSQVARCMSHVQSARCVTYDLHTIAPGPLERMCWRQFIAQ